MKWLNPDVLCSFGDDQVRIELGPQIIELDCTDENLRDEVTSPHYKIGGIDAYGRVIRPKEAKVLVQKNPVGAVHKGEKMFVVDWRSKHVPHVWKVYQWQETADLNPDDEPIFKFVKVAERADRVEAMVLDEEILGGMI